MHNYSYENEFNFHVDEICFSYEGMDTKTRFEKEAKGHSEMAYLIHLGIDFSNPATYMQPRTAAAKFAMKIL